MKPRSHIAAEEAKQKWQTEWITIYKAAATKQYFPSVRDRLGIKLTLTTKLAAVLTAHGKTRAYLYRFKIRDDARCICGQNDQTMDHLLFLCEKTSTQREVLKHQLSHQREWMEINPLKPELNPICYLLALLAHHFLQISRIRVKSLTLRRLMSYIYGAPILDVSRLHTTTHHSR